MKVLIYYPSSYLSVFILTVIEDLIAHNHKVYFLTTSPYGLLQEAAEKLGAEVHISKSPKGMMRIFDDIRLLVRFCVKNKIDFVFSHLQYLNLVAALSRHFIKAAVFPMRHHADDVYRAGNRNAGILDQLVNIFSDKILVVSEACKIQMTKFERVSAKKIIVLPLYYNFKLYDFGNSVADIDVPQKSQTSLTLINIGRMVKNKNHITLLQVMVKLVREGIDIKLILLDSGPLEPELKHFVTQNGLEQNVLFLGNRTNVMSYISAADILVHTSLSEASCQVVKEAGICGVPVITVKGMGDFDEYIVDQKNGFVISKQNMEDELHEILSSLCKDKSMLHDMGSALKQSIIGKFDVACVEKTYSGIVNG